MDLIDEIKQEKLPSHIAIIMDGNGRWAEKQGFERSFGHSHGVTPVREAIEGSAELGIRFLTLFAFSTENWSRPKNEIDALMDLLVNTIRDELETMMKNNIRLRLIGDIKRFPPDIYKKLTDGVEQTGRNTGLTVQIALSYSGRWDVMQAVGRVVSDVQAGRLDEKMLSEQIFSGYLSTSEVGDPELLIRTSGEYRISNFLLWQLAYTELYFCSVLWPDFRREHLYEAIRDFQHRERRFGRTSAQISSK